MNPQCRSHVLVPSAKPRLAQLLSALLVATRVVSPRSPVYEDGRQVQGAVTAALISAVYVCVLLAKRCDHDNTSRWAGGRGASALHGPETRPKEPKMHVCVRARKLSWESPNPPPPSVPSPVAALQVCMIHLRTFHGTFFFFCNASQSRSRAVWYMCVSCVLSYFE